MLSERPRVQIRITCLSVMGSLDWQQGKVEKHCRDKQSTPLDLRLFAEKLPILLAHGTSQQCQELEGRKEERGVSLLPPAFTWQPLSQPVCAVLFHHTFSTMED